MKKIILFLICFISFTVEAIALENPSLYSDNYVLYDLTDNKIMYEKNINKQTNIASLTKIMTTITAIEKISNLDDKVTVTTEMLSNIKYDASMAGLKVGDILTYRDVLYASILPSGADATQTLAYSLSGDIPSFVKDMNTLAKKIGMNNSNFVNVTGLDIDNHFSTINDLLTMLKYALNNETFKTIYETKNYTLSNGLIVDATVKKYNKLMNLDISRIIGSKTGFTNKAGLCLSSIFDSNNHEFIFISTNAPFIYGNYYNLKDNLNIIDFMDKNYSYQNILKKDDIVKNIPVKYSNKKQYAIKVKSDIEIYLPNDYDRNLIKIEYEGKEKISFLDNNKIIGKIKVSYNDEMIQQEDVVISNIKINNLILIVSSLLILLFIMYIFKKLFIKRKSKY